MHIYCFGSLSRGEVSLDSDVDLLALVDGRDDRFDRNKFSIYSYDRIEELWSEGNPFSWHLYQEAKYIYSDDKVDFIRNIGAPERYSRRLEDCIKFHKIFKDAKDSLDLQKSSVVLDLSTIFLAIRNFAICYSMKDICHARFSRNAAVELGKKSLRIERSAYNVFLRSRILSTRGIGDNLMSTEMESAMVHIPMIGEWMEELLVEVSSGK